MWLDLDDLERTFSALDELRRRMDRAFSEVGARDGGGLRFELDDQGDQLVLRCEVPGASRDAFDVQLLGQVLRVAGERAVRVPEGASTHRQERAGFRFARSFTLPVKVDPERVGAAYQDGILTVTLEKAKEALPRRITVKA